MKQSFWAQRWSEGLIGFNQPEPNEFLQRYWPQLGLPSSARVLVPLCGKSCDLLWLRAQGHAVVGVEFVPQAVSDFFTDNEIPFEPSSMGYRACDDGPPLTLIVGDFLTLQPRQLGPIDAVYDRASIVALPEAMQEAFATTLCRLMAPDTTGLLLSFEYPPEERQGPPFSTDQETLAQLFGTAMDLQCLAQVPLAPEEVERFAVNWCRSSIYRMTRS